MPSPIRVAFDHQIFGLQRFGGIARAFTRLVEELDRRDDVKPVLPFPFASSIYVERSRSFRAQRRVHRLGLRPASGSVRDLGRSLNRMLERPLLRRARFDVFQPTYFRDYFSGLLAGRPFVLWVPDMIPELFQGVWTESPHEDKSALLPRAVAVVAISETTRRDLLRLHRLPAETVRVVPLGPPFEAPPRGAAPPLPDEYLLFVGKRARYKNFERFAQVAAELMSARPALHLVCAGGGQLREREAAPFERAGCRARVLVFKPDDDELQWLYRRARLFVFPSSYEGFGLPILEAFASACPAALAATDVFREVAGEAAIYFDPLDAGSMADALARGLDDAALRRQVVEQGTRRLRDFSWRRMADSLAGLYREVAGARHA